LTKKQASPTSPIGTKSNTTPGGSVLSPLNPLSVTLGVQNASFVAQAVDWIPDLLYEVIAAAYRHKGMSFVRILQRCPEFMPGMFDPWIQDPKRMLLLSHADGVTVPAALAKVYPNVRAHDPSDRAAAREIADVEDPIPVGILYRDPCVPRYEELRHAGEMRGADRIRHGLEAELDRFTIWPERASV